jgi:electron transfer flavoprotein beta subunit
MKIIVCIKQVPDTNDVKIDPVTGTLIRQGVPSIINPDDLNALEQALQLKDSHSDVHVTVLCMGPPQADVAIRQAYAMGADKAILLSDRVFAGSDTWATATILAAAIRRIGDFLDIPQITYVRDLTIEGSMVRAERMVEDGHMVIEAPMPVLLTAIKELNKPRYPRMQLIYKAYSPAADIVAWNNGDIDADLTQIGVKNSPTNVKKSFVPVKEKHCIELTGTSRAIATGLVDELKKLHII